MPRAHDHSLRCLTAQFFGSPQVLDWAGRLSLQGMFEGSRLCGQSCSAACRGYLPLPKKSAKITTSHMPCTEAAGPEEDKHLPQPCLIAAKAPLERQRSVSAPRCIRCAA